MDSAYCTSADISWVSASGTSYIEYGPAGFMPGSGTVMSPATSPTTISGLMLNTSYDYYVYDICGGTDTSFGGLGSFMTPQGPVAAYTFSVNQGTVTFNASGSQGTNQWDWDFGDGTSGSGMMPSHTYLSNGSYSVSLVVTDTSCGVTDTLTQTVTITNIATCPQPSGLTTGAVACDSAVVNFTSISGSSLVQYGPAGFTPGTGTIVVATSPYVITGLN
jgi:PKD repeat protein